jgi:hypothetical protein
LSTSRVFWRMPLTAMFTALRKALDDVSRTVYFTGAPLDYREWSWLFQCIVQDKHSRAVFAPQLPCATSGSIDIVIGVVCCASAYTPYYHVHRTTRSPGELRSIRDRQCSDLTKTWRPCRNFLDPPQNKPRATYIPHQV